MIETINRKVDVEIKPIVGEIARIIWCMDSDEQASLLHQLAYHFGKNKSDGYMQMLNVANDVIERNDIDFVGRFIDDLHEYIGRETLRTQNEEQENKQ